MENLETSFEQRECNYPAEHSNSSISTCPFLNVIGPDSLQIYNSFDYSEDEDRTLVETVIAKFDKHFNGETNETYERYLFNKRLKESDESIDIYVDALRNLAKTCNFCECLHDSLTRDQTVTGVRNNAIKNDFYKRGN